MKLSDQFRKDYRQMTAQGVVFTPEDIVLLNALAVKTRLSATAARDVHLPRLAFLPRDSWWRAPLVLREPTIAHELWVEMARRFIDTSSDANFLFLHAFALSRHPGKLPDPTRPKKLIRAVYTFAGKRLAKFTRAQLSSAVEYCLFGADWTVGAHGPAPSTKHQAPSTSDEVASPTIGLLTDCRMLRLPISLDDAKQMTASELTEAINRCWENDGNYSAKAARNHAFGEYCRARDEIRKRSGKAATEASDDSRKTPPSNGSSTTRERQ